MDGLKGKRVSVPVMSRKTSGLVLNESMKRKKKKDDKSVPICSRIGCSSRISSSKGASFDHNTKSSLSSFRSSSNGKETVKSSSPSISRFGVTKQKTCRRQLSSLLDTDSSESKSGHGLPRGKTKDSLVSVHSETSVSGEVVTEAGKSSRGTRRSIHQTRDTHVCNNGQNAKANVIRRGLRDLRSKSVSDVIPSNPNPTRKSNIIRKKNSGGENISSKRVDKTDRPVIESRNQRSPQGNAITMSESRRNRNVPSGRDNNVVSSSTRRSSSRTIRAPRPATRVDLNPCRSAEVSNSPSNSNSRPISSNGRLCSLTRPGSPSEAGLSRSLVNRDSFRHNNINGVSEVLLALGIIEQDEDLTYEELVALENNLFLNSLQDQYRDMRLDIDNMSYEELLALEDEMGSVSTALSEEELLKSLNPSIYRETDEFRDKEDDIKCSICQEEYVDEDEVGTLNCQHMYHLSCAQQWLRIKNWCPICKSFAESSQTQPFS